MGCGWASPPTPYGNLSADGWVLCGGDSRGNFSTAVLGGLVFQNGRPASSPANRNPHSPTDNAVEIIRTMRLRCAQAPRQCPVFFSSRYQARLIKSTVNIRNGMFSTRKAGAIAAPVDAVPTNPRTAGITHHHGRGSIGAISLSSGFSMCVNFNLNLLMFGSDSGPDRCLR